MGRTGVNLACPILLGDVRRPDDAARRQIISSKITTTLFSSDAPIKFTCFVSVASTCARLSTMAIAPHRVSSDI